MFVLPSSQNFNVSLTDAKLPNGLNKIEQNKISLYTNNQSRLTIDSAGKIGINLDNPIYLLDINGTGAVRFPRGTTAQRPSGTNGLLRYNTDENAFEGYANGEWGAIGGGGGAIDTDEDTFIRAENPEGADNDELEFYTAGVERMNIGVSGDVRVNIGITMSGVTNQVSGGSVSDIGTEITNIPGLPTTLVIMSGGSDHVVYSEERAEYLAIASNNGGTNTAISSDGSTWNTYSQTFGMEQRGTLLWVPSKNFYARINGDRAFQTSPDGITWTTRETFSAAPFVKPLVVAYSPDLNLFSAVQDDKSWTSSDGITWTDHSSGITQFDEFSDFRKMIWVGDSVNLFIVLADGGGAEHIYTSPDGITWTGRTPAGTGGDLYDIDYVSKTGIIYILYRNATDTFQTSTDGINWSLGGVQIASRTDWTTFGYNPDPEFYYAIADTFVYLSTDANSWTEYEAASVGGDFEGFAFSKSLGNFVFGHGSGIVYTNNTIDFSSISYQVPTLAFEGNSSVENGNTSEIKFKNNQNEIGSIKTILTDTANNLGDIAIGVSGTDRLRIKNSGQVDITGNALLTGNLYLNDTDESINSDGNNTIFTVGGSERMRITDGGNVGIGTNNPSSTRLLHAYTTSGDAIISAETTDTSESGGYNAISAAGTAFLLTYPTSGGSGAASANGFTLGTGDLSDGIRIATFNSAPIKFYTGGATNERMRILSDGKVAIGTDVANQRGLHLHEASSSNVFTQYTNTTTGTTATDGFIVGINANEDAEFYNFENTNMLFFTNNAERMRILSTGLVGIGTNSPTTQLDVRNDQNLNTVMRVYNALNDTNALCEVRAETAGGRLRMFSFSPSYTTNGILAPDTTVIASENHTQLSIANIDGSINWYTTNTGAWTATERMSLGSTGTLTMKTTLHIDQGQVLSAGTNNTLYVNTTNNAVGIGTNAPADELEVRVDHNTDTRIRCRNNTNDTAANAQLLVQSNGGNIRMFSFPPGFTTNGVFIPDSSCLISFDHPTMNICNVDGSINWYTTNSGSQSSAVERMTLGSTGTLTMKTTLHIDQGQLLTAGTSNTLYVDTTNNEVGIGTNAPAYEFDVRTDQDGDTTLQVRNASTGSSALSRILVNTSGGTLRLLSFGSGYTTSGAAIADSSIIYSQDQTQLSIGSLDGSIKWYTGGASLTSTTERMELGSAGILTMKTRLHIDQGQLLTAGTNNTLYVDTTNNEVGIGTASPGRNLDVWVNQNTLTTARIINNQTDTAAGAAVRIQATGSSLVDIIAFSTGYTTAGAAIADGCLIATGNDTSQGLGIASYTGGIKWYTGGTGATTTVERMELSEASLTMKTTLYIDQGQVLQAGTSNTLYVDTTNNEVGIGTAAPGFELDIRNDVNTDTTLRILNNANNTAAYAQLRIQSNGGNCYMRTFSSSYTTSGSNIPDTFQLFADDALSGMNIVSCNGMSFWTGGTGATNASEYMTITSTGLVGIGTTNPTELFQVGSGTDLASRGARIDASYIGTWHSNADYAVFCHQVYKGTGTYALLQQSDGHTFLNAGGGNELALRIGNTDALVIDGSRNVGIGTNAPATRLHFYGNTGTSLDSRLLIEADNINGEPAIGWVMGDSTDGWLMGLNQAQTRLELFYGNAKATGTMSSGSVLFSFTNAGRVGIGSSTPNYALELSTDSAGKPTTNTWTISSDERLKENIQTANYDTCYNDIKSLDMKYFKWKDEYIEEHNVQDTHKIGWIADEVESIYPKAITEYNVGISSAEYEITGVTGPFKALNSDLIYAGMFGAMKKLIEKVEILEQEKVDMGVTIAYLLTQV